MSEVSWRILIVDDSPEDRAEMRRLLLLGSERGYHFSEAATGAECLRACLDGAAAPPDCILLDYHLPDYDALELLAMLGGSDSPRCPVVVVTGSSGPINSRAILDRGAQDFIGKGWMNPESLPRTIENAIERFRLDRELETSQARLQSFLENSATVAWMKDEQGRFVYLSETFEKRFDIRFEDFKGKTDFDVYPPRLAEQFRSNDLGVLASGRAVELLEEAANPDGSPSWWISHKFPFTDAAGRQFVGGLAVDITERVQVEEALRASEAFNRGILDSSADCIKVIDSEGRLILMNGPGQCAMEIDDFAPFKDKPWTALWPDSSAESIEAALRTARAGGVGRFQGYRPTAKGTPKWWDVVVTAMLDAAGQPTQFVSISRDITERKQAEAAVQEKERLLAESQAIAHIGSWMIDLRSGILTWSDEATRLYGFQPEMPPFLTFDTFLTLLHPDDRPAMLAWCEACLAGRSPPSLEFRTTLPDGSIRWLHGCGQRETGPDGEPSRMIGTVQDISERKLAEQTLRANEQRMRLATEATGVGIWEWNVLTSRIRWDEQMFRIYGIAPTPDGLVDYPTWSRAVLPEDLPRQEAVLQNTIRRLGRSSREFRILRADDGECRHIHAVETVRANAYGQAEWLVGTNLDITERKLAEEALRVSEALYRAIGETIDYGVWVCAPDGRNTYASESFLKLLGITQQQCADFGWGGLLEPGDAERTIEAWKECVRTGGNWDMEHRFRCADGQWHPILARGVPVKNEQGQIQCWAGINLDIGRLKQAEETLREQAGQLREADRRKDEFLAMLAHELRNPLTPIRLAAQLLQRDGSNPATLARCCEMIERQSSHLAQLVDDLLDTSRITSGKIELKKAPLNLADVVKWALETSRPLIDARRHQVTVCLPPEPLNVLGDPVRLTQVLANLLNNAAKYSADGGHITITARRQGNEAELSVRDKGIGIPAAALPRIFDLFTQADHPGNRAQGGLGIGLALVRSLLQMHGGRVEARSGGPGLGSEFTVYLPLALEHASDAPPPGGQAPASGASCRILVVDDNHDITDSLCLLLTVAGIEAHAAHDGPAAIKALDVFQPAVVLLDIGMPKMDGFEVARQIRRQPRFDEVALIALSGWNQEEDRRLSREAGFDHHLAKPVDAGALLALLASLPGFPAS